VVVVVITKVAVLVVVNGSKRVISEVVTQVDVPEVVVVADVIVVVPEVEVLVNGLRVEV
jgi:hypothetical protein